MKYRFAGVFRYCGNLYITRERKVGGPRCILFPPIKLDPDIEIEAIGREVLSALDSFEVTTEKLTPEQWSHLNKELLDYVGAKSVAEFERSKKEVTVRHDLTLDAYFLIGPNEKGIELQSPTKIQLGEIIVRLLE